MASFTKTKPKIFLNWKLRFESTYDQGRPDFFTTVRVYQHNALMMKYIPYIRIYTGYKYTLWLRQYVTSWPWLWPRHQDDLDHMLTQRFVIFDLEKFRFCFGSVDFDATPEGVFQFSSFFNFSELIFCTVWMVLYKRLFECLILVVYCVLDSMHFQTRVK